MELISVLRVDSNGQVCFLSEPRHWFGEYGSATVQARAWVQGVEHGGICRVTFSFSRISDMALRCSAKADEDVDEALESLSAARTLISAFA